VTRQCRNGAPYLTRTVAAPVGLDADAILSGGEN